MHLNAHFCIIVIFSKLDTKVFLHIHNNLVVNIKKNYIVKLMFYIKFMFNFI